MGIALFGGSFDPFHLGHLELVKQTLSLPYISKIIIIPNYISPLKNKENLSIKHRTKLINLSLDSLETNLKNKCEISTFESNSKEQSYSYKTVKHFSDIYLQNPLYWILGEDSFYSLHLWKNTSQFIPLLNLILFKRNKQSDIGAQEYLNLNKLNPKSLIEIKNKYINLSSTEIRKNVSLTNFELLDEQITYINDNNLY